MKRIAPLTLFASLAACTAAPPESSTASNLVIAGEAAQAYDVAGYVVEEGSVKIVGRDHRDLGVLTMIRTAVDTVYVSVDNDRGHLYDNELTRPMADGWLRVLPTVGTRSAAVESDPALAPFFAREKVEFLQASLPHTTGALDPAAVTTCSSNPVPLCNAASGCWEYQGCSEYSGSGWTRTERTCMCPRVECDGFNYDGVWRQRYCADPGSCSNANYVVCLY